MSISERIKNELFNADINYYAALARFKAEFPHGVNFCYDDVSSKAATMYASLQRAEGAIMGLSYLVDAKLRGSELEVECCRLVDEYNNAETEEAALSAEQAYYKLYSIRK